jgi:hypothetical protein
MFGDLNWWQALMGYFFSGVVFGILFFWGKTLIGQGSAISSWWRSLIGFVTVLVSLAFAMLALLMLTLIFVKAFWLAVAGLVALIIVFYRIVK